MDNESNASDPYEAVLSDLKSQRDRIDQAINLLEALRASPPPRGGRSFIGGAGLDERSEQTNQAHGMGPGAFLGMTISDATKKLLAHERRQMPNGEIVEALKRGGLVMNSAEPINTVGAVLTRRFQQVGDIVKVGRGVWGLKEWYPNRSFKSATTKGPDEVAAQKATNAPPSPAASETDEYGFPIIKPASETPQQAAATGPWDSDEMI